MPEWNVPKDRGDGIYVTTHKTVKLPTKSCDKDNMKQDSSHLYVDIHIMNPTKGGYNVGKMKYLWSAFLKKNGVLPEEIIFPLNKCQWGGGTSWAPAKYIDILANWDKKPSDAGGEYGTRNTLWKPIERIMATGDWFTCQCDLNASDEEEIKNSIRSLKNKGMAALEIPTKDIKES